jgi:hypothetical protein
LNILENPAPVKTFLLFFKTQLLLPLGFEFIFYCKDHVLCEKSILAGSNFAKSLSQGKGIVAIHNPKMAATSARVQRGSRNMYERMRVGLNCGKEGMADRDGGKSTSRQRSMKVRMADEGSH